VSQRRGTDIHLPHPNRCADSCLGRPKSASFPHGFARSPGFLRYLDSVGAEMLEGSPRSSPDGLSAWLSRSTSRWGLPWHQMALLEGEDTRSALKPILGHLLRERDQIGQGLAWVADDLNQNLSFYPRKRSWTIRSLFVREGCGPSQTHGGKLRGAELSFIRLDHRLEVASRLLGGSCVRAIGDA
jgi:hypothetical protein